MAALREVIAKFGVEFDSQQLDRGNKSLDAGIGKLKLFAAAIAGSAVVNGIRNMVAELANEADVLNKQSRALGFSTQEFQGWQHAANLAGVEGEAFGKSVAKMQRAAAEAADGIATYADAFKLAGVDVKDTATGDIKPTTQLLDELATGIMGIDDPARRTAVAMDIFGRQGVSMISLFEAGPEGIKKLREELDLLGGGFTDEFANNAEEMNDNISRMDLASKSLKVTIGNFLIPILSRLAIRTAHVVGAFSKWAKGAIEVVKRTELVKAVVTWIGVTGAAYVVKLAGGLRALWSMFLRGASIVARFAAKFLLPILLLDELFTFFAGGETIIGRAMDRMFGEGTAQKVRDFAIGVYQEIKSLLSRIVQAFKLDGFDKIKALFPELSDGWANLLAGLIVALQTAGAFIVALFTGDTEKIGAAWDYLGTWLEAIALEIDAPFVMAAMGIADAFTSAWNTVIAGAQKALNFANKVIDKVPGARQLLNAISPSGAALLSGGAQAIEGAKGSTNRAAEMQAQYDTSRLDIAQRQNQAAAVFSGSGSSVSSATTVNVTVPPGTPANVARSVGNAAADGARRGNRASLAAVQRLAPG